MMYHLSPNNLTSTHSPHSFNGPTLSSTLRLDSKSIATALPVLQADVEEWFGGAGQGVVKAYSKVGVCCHSCKVLFELVVLTFLQLEDGARPYVEKAVVGGKKLWAEGGSKVGILFSK